jgi:hypothetical protein
MGSNFLAFLQRQSPGPQSLYSTKPGAGFRILDVTRRVTNQRSLTLSDRIGFRTYRIAKKLGIFLGLLGAAALVLPSPPKQLQAAAKTNVLSIA